MVYGYYLNFIYSLGGGLCFWIYNDTIAPASLLTFVATSATANASVYIAGLFTQMRKF